MRQTCVIALAFAISVVICVAADAEVLERVDLAAEGGGNPSMAVDSSDNIHITYRSGVYEGLSYATNKTGSWVTETVDSGDVGRHSSIAVDGSDAVHTSFYDVTNEDLKYATNASGSWITETLDAVGSAASYADNSIAIDTQDKAHITYEDDTDGVKYVSDASGSWVIESLDPSGADPSIAVDSMDKVHISYYGGGELMYATNASGAWVIETVGTGGSDSSIALDSMDKVHISYQGLMYATNASGSWVIENVYDCSNPWTGASCGYLPSIALDSSDKAHISSVGSIDGWFDYLFYTTNASGSWMTVGGYGLALLDKQEITSIALDSSGIEYISYSGEDYFSDGKYKLMLRSSRCVPEICDNILDDDCDGLYDDQDPSCAYSATANAEASVYGIDSVIGSGIFNEMILVLIPVGAVIFLNLWRRRR